jgi:uncharacterized protein involved in exopolysaccharide biosynthesis
LKLSLHEQKVLDIISNHPEVLDNPKDRTRIAKIYNLTEKTLRNRIAELKKRGLINNNESQLDNLDSTMLDLNIQSLFKLLLKRKIFIIKWTSFITMTFVIYSLIATPFFESKITLYPAGNLVESGNMIGNLQGLAESFGLGNNGNNQTFNIPDIVNSRRLKKSIILNKWNSNSFKSKVNLIEFWEIDKPKFFNPKKWIKDALPFPKTTHDTLGAQIFDALERLNKSILIEEKVTGLIEVSVVMEEPSIASDIANYIAEFVKNFVAAEQKKEASRNKEFIYEQLIKSKIDLEKSEEGLTSFREKNPFSRIPSLEEHRGRLERNIESNQQVYITLRQQYEIAKIDEARDYLLVTILDKAEPAIFKSRPKRTLITIAGFITGLFLSFFSAFFISIIRLNTPSNYKS